MKAPSHIIVIGTSAGGLNSVLELCAQFTADLDASVFVVMHLNESSRVNIIIDKIQSVSVFTCRVASNNEKINRGVIYFGIPEHHLVIKKGTIVLGEGPAENRWRPSIDVLFRSAAAAYGNRVIGIILTGLLQDGV